MVKTRFSKAACNRALQIYQGKEMHILYTIRSLKRHEAITQEQSSRIMWGEYLKAVVSEVIQTPPSCTTGNAQGWGAQTCPMCSPALRALQNMKKTVR